MSGIFLRDLNFCDYYPNIELVKSGDLPKRLYPFSKLKFEENIVYRVGIITSDVICVGLHYCEDTHRSIICTRGKCCNLFKRPVSLRYIYPVVYYRDVSDYGDPITDKIEVKLLVLNSSVYNSISLLSEVMDLSSHDLKLTCTSSKYQTCLVEDAGRALWLNNKDIVIYVIDYVKANISNILDPVGVILGEDQLNNYNEELIESRGYF